MKYKNSKKLKEVNLNNNVDVYNYLYRLRDYKKMMELKPKYK